MGHCVLLTTLGVFMCIMCFSPIIRARIMNAAFYSSSDINIYIHKELLFLLSLVYIIQSLGIHEISSTAVFEKIRCAAAGV
jgi:hypothetical protein